MVEMREENTMVKDLCNQVRDTEMTMQKQARIAVKGRSRYPLNLSRSGRWTWRHPDV